MIWMILYILFWHWVADFVAQTHEMAINKSTSNKWLLKHIIAYGNNLLYGSLPLLIYAAIIGQNWSVIIVSYVLINMVLHFITDYFTSRWTSKLWVKKDVHNFFVVIGLDQLIHTFCLILTYIWIVG
jgi:hypothetical protein